MAYVAIGRIKKAIDSLQRFHAFFGVTFLSMKQSGVSSGAPIAWGSQQENALLNEYFTPPGAPPDKPFFVPLGRPDSKSGFWKNPKYSGGVLQRARTTDNFKPALVHPTEDTWGFTKTYLDELAAQLPKQGGAPEKIPVLDLAAWLFRDKDLPKDLRAVEKLFRTTFNLTDNTEYSRLFDFQAEVPDQYFFDKPADQDELIHLIGGVPPGPALRGRTEEQLLSALEEWIAQKALLELPAGFVRLAYHALKSQRFLVLAGRPGTGKTAFARAFTQGLRAFFGGAVSEIVIGVGPDFSESDVIGYEKIAGDLAATELTRTLFLSGRPNDIYVVILDEMNLAQVDHYLARLLPAIESDAPVELPGDTGKQSLPADTFVIGTINSYLEEPTRLPLSGPVKRRAHIIEMPNPLNGIVQGDDQQRFAKVCSDLLAQARQRIKARYDEGSISVFDTFRVTALDEAIATASPMKTVSFTGALFAICKACAAHPATGLTLGVLQDVLEFIALSKEEPLTALDRQLAFKIAPQLQGPASVVRGLIDTLNDLATSAAPFAHAKDALDQLAQHADRGTGMIIPRY